MDEVTSISKECDKHFSPPDEDKVEFFKADLEKFSGLFTIFIISLILCFAVLIFEQMLSKNLAIFKLKSSNTLSQDSFKSLFCQNLSKFAKKARENNKQESKIKLKVTVHSENDEIKRKAMIRIIDSLKYDLSISNIEFKIK